MEILFLTVFRLITPVGLFRLGSKSQLVDFFANFCHMVDLSFVSTTVFELSKSEFV
jgi:hypothetical protein